MLQQIQEKLWNHPGQTSLGFAHDFAFCQNKWSSKNLQNVSCSMSFKNDRIYQGFLGGRGGKKKKTQDNKNNESKQKRKKNETNTSEKKNWYLGHTDSDVFRNV